MDIREKIGTRITLSRKALGITIRELAVRTQTLSAARIGNWEQGTRSPGPLEAQLLAEHLQVSPSYLLCLTDSPLGELSASGKTGSRTVPILSMEDAMNVKTHLEKGLNFEKNIIVDATNPTFKKDHTLFALILVDESMQPEFKEGDLVVVDPQIAPKPGDFVLAHLVDKNSIVLRKYRETEKDSFQLLALNDLWTTITVEKTKDCSLLGVIIEKRCFKFK